MYSALDNYMDSSGASECKSFNLLEETEGFINLAV
jgi:hypothetical protein